MRTIEEHRRDVTALVSPIAEALEAESLAVSGEGMTAHPERYLHRVLAVDLLAPSSLPAFDNSQMDGFAVLSADLTAASAGSPVTLPVVARVAAGDPGARHAPGTATPVMTGAPVPVGADAIVPVEHADPPAFPAQGSDSGTVSFVRPVEAGTFVRTAGSDVTRGDLLLRSGTRLGPAQWGVIAGTGATTVQVRRRPRVLLVATGHEIRDAGSELQPGQIFDSNTVALTAALQSIGCVVTAVPCRSDDAADLIAIVAAHSAVDLVVTVGGVSAGAREVVRDAFTTRGVRFEKVAMQPGGPQGFGRVALPVVADHREGAATGSLPIVCLPGNPVSALVSFEAFLRPALLTVLGVDPAVRELRRGPAAHSFESPAGSHQLRRGRVRADGALELVGGPSSHLLHSYAESTVLVHVPVGVNSVAAGDELDYWRIDG